jgi:hypothetical protein
MTAYGSECTVRRVTASGKPPDLSACCPRVAAGNCHTHRTARTCRSTPKPAVLSNVLDYGVGRGLDVNPLPRAGKMWTSPRTTEGAVDPQVVLNTRDSRRLRGWLQQAVQDRSVPSPAPAEQ